jgi:23S rRNA (cytosine1962-C5)-methyltransferase
LENSVVLKKRRDKAVRQHHHWVFSGAIYSYPKDYKQGGIYPVKTAEGELLGHGYFNKDTSIAGRMLNTNDEDPLLSIAKNIDQAIALRKQVFDPSLTNAYRLINGEGDRLPGLIVDVYDDVLVMQISTLGMEKLKKHILSLLLAKLTPRCIYEKSLSSVRKMEKLDKCAKTLHGKLPEKLLIRENGLVFQVDIEKGQKTGFFLDQREMRKKIQSIAQGKRVLNAFSYSGGFSIAALAGGADSVDSVDISESAIALAEENVLLNGFDKEKHHGHVADVFAFLRDEPIDYDLVILDPPAFAKMKQHVNQACRGYKDINRIAMKKMPSNSFLLTCSCSHFVDEKLFQQVLFQAAAEAGRQVQILDGHHQATDHPVNLMHPEGQYLKSFLLYLS